MESLYGVLGVEPDADEQRIMRAYRELAKRYHPDVADTPDASERFKRLTTAKEVLTDADERARYDRLGHERYVRQYLDDSWTVDGTPGSPTDDAATAEAAQRVAGDTPSGTAEPSSGQRVSRTDGYATASEYYRPGHRVGAESRSSLARTLGALREVLPWLLAHLALLGGSIAVAAVLLGSAGGVPPATTIIVAVVMVGATAGVSALHISTALFR